MSLGLDIKGGVYVVMEANKKDIAGMSDDELREAMEQTQTVIENRINANGLGEPTITIEGQDRIRVEIPEVEDPEEAIELIGKTAKLQFILADGTLVLEGKFSRGRGGSRIPGTVCALDPVCLFPDDDAGARNGYAAGDLAVRRGGRTFL